MVLGNGIAFVVVLFAIARLGAISVPLNTRHTLAENSHIIRDCAAKIVVHELGPLRTAFPRRPSRLSLKHAIAIRQ